MNEIEVEIKTLPDGTRYAVVMEWTSRGRACPVHLPKDVIAIDADIWLATRGDPELAVKMVGIIQRVGRRHRRVATNWRRNEREIEADRQSRRGWHS